MGVISIENVTKKFLDITVLSNVSLEIDNGTITGLVGRNGSGKTVLMKCFCGLISPTPGRIIVQGKQIGKDVDIPDNIGVIIETPGFSQTSPHTTILCNSQRYVERSVRRRFARQSNASA